MKLSPNHTLQYSKTSESYTNLDGIPPDYMLNKEGQAKNPDKRGKELDGTGSMSPMVDAADTFCTPELLDGHPTDNVLREDQIKNSGNLPGTDIPLCLGYNRSDSARREGILTFVGDIAENCGINLPDPKIWSVDKGGNFIYTEEKYFAFREECTERINKRRRESWIRLSGTPVVKEKWKLDPHNQEALDNRWSESNRLRTAWILSRCCRSRKTDLVIKDCEKYCEEVNNGIVLIPISKMLSANSSFKNDYDDRGYPFKMKETSLFKNFSR